MADKVALVVGAGDATGGAVARRFAREGFAVCVTRRNADKLEPLVRCIEAEARKQGFTRLYLYTEDRVPFYTYLGWQAIEERVYRGYPMTVMMRDLRQDPPAVPDRQTA